MRRKLPPHVDRNIVKGHVYLSFRIGKGSRIRLPADPLSPEFREAYAAAMAGQAFASRPAVRADKPKALGALIASYKASNGYKSLAPGSKVGYASRLEQIREQHGHRSVDGLTKERIDSIILAPLADRPGAALDTLKKLRILIRHAIDDKKWGLKFDPSQGLK